MNQIWEDAKCGVRREQERRDRVRALEADLYPALLDMMTEAPQERMEEIAADAGMQTWPEAVFGDPPEIWRRWQQEANTAEITGAFEAMKEIADAYVQLRRRLQAMNIGTYGQLRRRLQAMNIDACGVVWQPWNMKLTEPKASAGKDGKPAFCEDRENRRGKRGKTADKCRHDHDLAVTAALAGFLGAAAGLLIVLALLLVRRFL